MQTNAGNTVAEISQNKKVLLIFLRHLACIFCREALKDIRKIRSKLNEMNVEVVFVHMAKNEIADEIFETYKIPDIQHISDINKDLYMSFGLAKGDFKQLFGFKSFLGMGRAGIKGNIPSTGLIGDPNQMPGVFIIEDKKVVNYFIYNSVGDYPNYLGLVKKVNTQ
jgi:peroxiredoxin